MTHQKHYPGLTRAQLANAALLPESYALDERSLLDHLGYIQRFTRGLRFHDRNSVEKGSAITDDEKRFWCGFVDFTDDELVELAQLAEHPELFECRLDLKEKYAKPHYALLLTFIQLLGYAKQRQQTLTRAHLDFCYRTSLQIAAKDAQPDQLHVIFTLAETVDQLEIKAGQRVDAGTDDNGQRIEYALQQDILLNHAQVTDIRTVQFIESVTTLAQVHQQQGQGIDGFDAMLKLALGGIAQLPDYPGSRGKQRQIDSQRLLTNWYVSSRGQDSQNIAAQRRAYIFDCLNFSQISDWQTVFEALYDEVRGELINDQQWQGVYRILAMVHQQTQIKQRMGQIRDIHLTQGVTSMFNWLFGEPAPGNWLYPMPELSPAQLSTKQQQQVKTYPLAKLYFVADSDCERYINDHLAMSLVDFGQVWAKLLGEPYALCWPNVYRILELAWRHKRGTPLLPIEQKRIVAMQTKTHYSNPPDSVCPAFSPFGHNETDSGAIAADISSEHVDLGLLLSSDTLQMAQGQRQIEVVLDCQPGTLPVAAMDALKAVLVDGEPQPLFYAYLSTAQGWQPVDRMQLDYGELICDKPLRALDRHQIWLRVSLPKEAMAQLTLQQPVLMPDGDVYIIAEINQTNLELLLKPLLSGAAIGESPIKDRADLSDLTLQSVILADPDIQFAVSAASLSVSCPQGTLSEAVVAKWQQLCLDRTLDPGRFSLEVETGSAQAITDDSLTLENQDCWQQRYESLDPFGLKVVYQGRRDDSPRLTIKANGGSAATDFAVVAGELVITPGLAGATANGLAAAWRLWCQDKPNQDQGFAVSSSDNRLWPVTPVDAQPIAKLAQKLKVASLVDENSDGICIECICPESVAAFVLISENLVDDYDFNIGDHHQLTILIPSSTPTTAAKSTELVEAWQKWSADVLNDPWAFNIKKKGKKDGVVEVQTEAVALKAAADQFYRFRTAQLPYLQVDYCSKKLVPYLTMKPVAGNTFTIEVSKKSNVMTLEIGYPQLPAHCQLERLFEQWLALNQHQGFVLSDSSERVMPRQRAPLTPVGNMIKRVACQGMDIGYSGPNQDVTVSVNIHQSFSSECAGQQLLLNSGLLLTIKENINIHEAKIEQGPVTGLQGQCGLYPAGAIKLSAMRFEAQVSNVFAPIVPNRVPNGTRDGELVARAGMKIVLNNHFIDNSDNSGNSDNVFKQSVFLADIFAPLMIEQAKLTVNVSEITTLAAKTDDGIVDTGAEFALFGHLPEVGAWFDFSSSELCGKPLDELTFAYQWSPMVYPLTGLPMPLPDLACYYHNYSRMGETELGDVSRLDHTIDLHYYSNNNWHILQTGQPLFTNHQQFNSLSQQWANEAALVAPDSKDPSTMPARLRLVLNHGVLEPAFNRLRDKQADINQAAQEALNDYDSAVIQNIAYRQTKQAALVSAAMAKQQGVPFYPPLVAKPPGLPDRLEELQTLSQRVLPLPYTPMLQKVTLGYGASSQLDLRSRPFASEAGTRPALPLELYCYHPFGVRRMGHSAEQDNFMLPPYESQGVLYLGLSHLSAGQTVSLLFQLLSGSGKPGLEPPTVRWAYLATDNWQRLPGDHLLADETRQLQNSGLVQLTIPANAALNQTLMPSGKIWLRLEFGGQIEAVPTIEMICCQAACAGFVIDENNQIRLGQPLDADTVKGLVSPIGGIQKVSQPFASFGGRASENEAHYYQRVAAHLQHKSRCLTSRDYESMILAQFPQIIRVKCLPAALIRAERDSRGIEHGFSEQDLLIFVVAASTQTSTQISPLSCLRPACANPLLHQIEDFVAQHHPTLVSVAVSNPTFEELTYRLAVRFKPGKDSEYYSVALNQALVGFLSPWACQAASAVVEFGNTIYNAAVIGFIESLDYIDYVGNLTLLHQLIHHSDHIEDVPLFIAGGHQASARLHGGILVSAGQHIITVIDTDHYDAGAFDGIGYMMIGADNRIS
ncbi:MAG: hypothetical protein ACI8WB_001022 [Phenylobacterium sp.]